MGDHVYKSTELTGSSNKSIDDAVRTAIELASQTVRDIRWFEVLDTRGNVKDGKVAHWQVTEKVGFTLNTRSGWRARTRCRHLRPAEAQDAQDNGVVLVLEDGS